MSVIILVILGLAMGSFANALVWRLFMQHVADTPKVRAQDYSILRGRSMCPVCKHKLSALDLVPVLSYLALKGRCRYCHVKISPQYPAAELVMALVFVLSYLFWPVPFTSPGQWLLFGSWLAASVGLLALAIYDARWMILPNHLIYPTLTLAAIGRVGYIIFYSPQSGADSFAWLGALAVASGIFWFLFRASNGRLIGYGDVRLGLIIGTLVATPAKALGVIFFASLAGLIVALPRIIAGTKNIGSKLPFGPFLIAATAFIMLFGQPLIDWYKRLVAA